MDLEATSDIAREMLGHAAVRLADDRIFPSGSLQWNAGANGLIQDHPTRCGLKVLAVNVPRHPAIGGVKARDTTLRHESDYTAGRL